MATATISISSCFAKNLTAVAVSSKTRSGSPGNNFFLGKSFPRKRGFHLQTKVNSSRKEGIQTVGMNIPSWVPFVGNSVRSSSAETVDLGPDDDVPGPGLQFATFGAGCFWGIELAYQRVPGVVKTEVGYTQGHAPNPTYEAVCSGRTGHTEAVRVQFDPTVVSYDDLLNLLWSRIDPTAVNRQGNDVGTQYRAGIYYYSPEQEQVARESMAKVQEKLGSRKVGTELLPAKKWFRAESYHQQYLSKGGRFGTGQSAEKGCKDTIRCYG